MSTVYHITDVPLPLSQDFNKLKNLGLDYIQRHNGNTWNNLNPSDPGVTILDQVCYALTELGYVNDFPMCDILTRKDGKLQIRDQFYLPEELLTTSPVTLDDYRKYIIDGIAAVKNVVMAPVTTSDNTVSGMYNVYLQVDETMIISKEAICQSVFFYLNKRRNLNEFFLLPQLLTKQVHQVGGRLDIQKETDLTKILTAINDKVRDYIFPYVETVSYDALATGGMATNEIFNGPLLLHGWIPTDALGTKKDQLYVFELADLINTVSGINSASGLTHTALMNPSGSPESLIYTVDVFSSFESGKLEIYCEGKQIMPSSITAVAALPRKSLKANVNIQFGATMNIQTELPTGRFRDIESYYSIQNTFPEIYAVGADAVDADAPDFRIAQSRQLKGYLTLFDQVLSNQFSQLANLDRLFSFKNAMTDEVNDFRRRFHQYPVPYKTFSPTYFYQPLYDVPHIRPLLKRYKTFDFGTVLKPKKLQEDKSWKQYMNDPYNPYIRGLMEFMEDEKNSVERRNKILDHLLAQNGESPYVINRVIDPLLYTGDPVKGQIIFKSLYLQNLGLLSYYRQKGYNYLGAVKISSEATEVKEDYEHYILGGDTMDFVFLSGKVDRIEKVKKQDFINYSTLELKLFLLCGLRIQYLNYISKNYNVKENGENIKLAQWMIQQRRGVIVIETGLLFQYGGDKLQELQKNPIFNNKVILFFPSFVPAFTTPEFKNRLEIFFQSSLPVQVPAKSYFIESDALLLLIKLFTAWHNLLVYNGKQPGSLHSAELAASAELLALFIVATNDPEHAGNK